MTSHNLLGYGIWFRPASTSLVDKIGVDERYKLVDILGRKLRNVPNEMIPKPRKRDSGLLPSRDDLTLADVLDHEEKAIHLPQ